MEVFALMFRNRAAPLAMHKHKTNEET